MDGNSLEEARDRFEGRTYKTYMARLETAKRLNLRSQLWSFALVASSTASALLAVLQVVDSDAAAARPGPGLTIAVLTLALSLAVSAMDYGRRASDMKRNYRAVQRISAEAEALKGHPELSVERLDAMRERYESLLDESENQSGADFARSLVKKGSQSSRGLWKDPVVWRSAVITLAPVVVGGLALLVAAGAVVATVNASVAGA